MAQSGVRSLQSPVHSHGDAQQGNCGDTGMPVMRGGDHLQTDRPCVEQGDVAHGSRPGPEGQENARGASYQPGLHRR